MTLRLPRFAVVVSSALVGALGTLSAMPSAVAGPPASTFGCAPSFATLSPSGSLDQRTSPSANVTAAPWTDVIATHSGVTTMSSTSHTHLDASDRHYVRTLMVSGGALTHAMTSYPNTDPSARTTTLRRFGVGWGGFTRLVDATDRGTLVTKAGYLYGLNPTTGVLARYSVVEGRSFGDLTVRNAGAATGYKSFRGLTLMYRYRAGYPGAADVLFATTAGGALYQVTIPNTSTFAPRLTLVRASTWTFDQLAAVSCGTHTALLGIRTGTDRAYLYRVESYAGTSSVVRGYGQVGSSWPATHTAGFWDSLSSPSRW